MKLISMILGTIATIVAVTGAIMFFTRDTKPAPTLPKMPMM